MEEVLIVLESEVTIDVLMAKMITQLYYKIGKTQISMWFLDGFSNWYFEGAMWLASALGLNIWLAESAIQLASAWNP